MKQDDKAIPKGVYKVRLASHGLDLYVFAKALLAPDHDIIVVHQLPFVCRCHEDGREAVGC